MRRARAGMTAVEVLFGVVVLAICTAPILGCVLFTRNNAADAATEAVVVSALNEQIAQTRYADLTTALSSSTNTINKTLTGGVALSITTTVSPVSAFRRLSLVRAVGSWKSRSGEKSRSVTLETYVYAPDN